MSNGEEPYRFVLEFDIGNNVVRAVHWGVCTLPDLKKSVDAVVTDPRWTPGMGVFTDFREANASRLSSEDMRNYAVHLGSHTAAIAGSRAATIVDKPLNFGMVRVWEAHAAIQGHPVEHRLFQSVEEAEAWLGWARKNDSRRFVSRRMAPRI